MPHESDVPEPDTRSNATHSDRLTAATSVNFLRPAGEPLLQLPDDDAMFPVLRIEGRITGVRPRQVSSNDNEYTALQVAALDEQVFVWNDTWRHEIEEHVDAYTGLDAVVWYRDKSAHPADHWSRTSKR